MPSRRPRSRKANPTRALQDAETIARSARADTIDWTREPLTERERKVRFAILKRVQSDPLLVNAFGRYYPAASDLTAMLAEAATCGPKNTDGLLDDAKAEVDAELGGHDEPDDDDTDAAAPEARLRDPGLTGSRYRDIWLWVLEQLPEPPPRQPLSRPRAASPKLPSPKLPSLPSDSLSRPRETAPKEPRPVVVLTRPGRMDADTFAALHDEHFLTINDVASLTGLSYNFIASRVAHEEIESYYFGRRRMVKAGALRKYIADSKAGER